MADPLSLSPIPGSADLRTEHLVLMVAVPIAAVMVLTGVFVTAYLATPIGKCHKGGVLGQLVIHEWGEPCGGTEAAPSQR